MLISHNQNTGQYHHLMITNKFLKMWQNSNISE